MFVVPKKYLIVHVYVIYKFQSFLPSTAGFKFSQTISYFHSTHTRVPYTLAEIAKAVSVRLQHSSVFYLVKFIDSVGSD